jgi:predicted nicotinamide N-methyase
LEIDHDGVTKMAPSILAVVEWDHEGYYNQEEQTAAKSLTKIRLENGSLPHLVERIRQELLHVVHNRPGDDEAIIHNEAVVCAAARFFEISIYDANINNHRILFRGEMSMGGQDFVDVVALDPHTVVALQEQEEHQPPHRSVEPDEDLTQRYGRRWRLRVTSVKTKNGQEQQPLLAIQGRSYAPYENLVIAGTTLHIHERWNDQSNHTAFTIWDASLVLARYLEENQNWVIGKNVLELGAGCGVAGMAAACSGAQHVILTDRPEIVPHLQANVDANLRTIWLSSQDFDDSTARKSSSSTSSSSSSSLPTRSTPVVTCQALDWFQPPASSSLLAWSNGGNVDVILVSDCVWTVDLVEPLLNTLQVLTQSNNRIESLNDEKKAHVLHHNHSNSENSNVVVVVIAYQRRGLATHQAFWKGMHHLFHVETLPSPSQLRLNERLESASAGCGCAKTDLFQCTRKR